MEFRAEARARVVARPGWKVDWWWKLLFLLYFHDVERRNMRERGEISLGIYSLFQPGRWWWNFSHTKFFQANFCPPFLPFSYFLNPFIPQHYDHLLCFQTICFFIVYVYRLTRFFMISIELEEPINSFFN